MEKSYIVRADFYPDGKIVPLGITDCQGNSILVQRSKIVFSNGKGTHRFECTAKNKQFCLEFKDGNWYVSVKHSRV